MHYFSLHCSCGSLGPAVPLHYPAAGLSKNPPTAHYLSTMLPAEHKDSRKIELWTQNSITHVLQRCWFPGELSPALCPNPSWTWKADKYVSGTSPLLFSHRLDAPPSRAAAWPERLHAAKSDKLITTEVQPTATTAVVNISRAACRNYCLQHDDLCSAQRASGWMSDLNVQKTLKVLFLPERERQKYVSSHH